MPANDPSTPEPPPLRWWTDVDPCPPWCEGGHEIEAEPGDWWHSRSIRFPVLLPNPSAAEYLRGPGQHADMAVNLERDAADENAWVSLDLGRADNRTIKISPKSTAKTIPGIRQLLADLPLVERPTNPD